VNLVSAHALTERARDLSLMHEKYGFKKMCFLSSRTRYPSKGQEENMNNTCIGCSHYQARTPGPMWLGFGGGAGVGGGAHSTHKKNENVKYAK
jgi:hypothetical protein